MKIVISMDLDDGYADPDHPMGITEDAYMQLAERLSDMGTDINISKVHGSWA